MTDRWPIGVFTSLDEGLGVRFDVLQELAIPTIQLHAPSVEHRQPQRVQELSDRLEKMGVTCSAVFGGFANESYQDIPTVAKTVGLVPPSTRAKRMTEMLEIAAFAHQLGCDTVGLHLGFIPPRSTGPAFEDLVSVTRELCDACARNDQYLHLETGQETAEGLLDFIDAVERHNLKINFDPANMIMYGTGEPIEALQKLGKHVRSVHCKDAKWSDQPGVTWGREVALGEGDVGIEDYLRTLLQLGYSGPLTIEREIPDQAEQQKADIGAASDLLRNLTAALNP